MAEKAVKKEVVHKFTKKQLLTSKKYKDKPDLINAFLKDDIEYSFDEVDKIIEGFYK